MSASGRCFLVKLGNFSWIITRSYTEKQYRSLEASVALYTKNSNVAEAQEINEAKSQYGTSREENRRRRASV